MTKKLSNLEKIKAACGMGWAAIISNGNKKDDLVVIGLGERAIHMKKLSNDCGGYHLYHDEINGDRARGELFQITGYLYAGQLAGNEPIPEGQRFRVKNPNNGWNGEIGIFMSQGRGGIVLEIDNPKRDVFFYREEIEPVFD